MVGIYDLFTNGLEDEVDTLELEKLSAAGRVRILRSLAGMKQAELAGKAGISVSYLSRFEQGWLRLRPEVEARVLRIAEEAAHKALEEGMDERTS